MALMNLGMGGFAAPRADSQVVGSSYDAINNYGGWLSDWQKRYADASRPVYSSDYDMAVLNAGRSLDPMTGVIQADAAFGRNGAAGDPAAQSALQGVLNPSEFANINNASRSSYQIGTQGDVNGLMAEQAKMEAMRQQIATQQQAYDQQNGGGFAGGILNDSYSQPFSNTVTGAPSAQQGFGTGLMGGAGTTAAPSTGLTPFGAPAAPQGQQMANAGGWGGPFSNKNPWSLG